MKPELILPGGDLERVKIAFQYGADAVYVGMNKHSLRKAEVRFDIPQIKEAIEYAHSLGKRLFVTFNIFAHNEHLADIEKDMAKIARYKPDAFIMADLGVINIAGKVAPNVPIHVSTQANTVNIEDVKFWRDFGAKRVVLARELTLKEIAVIHKAVPDIELEAFVHGSMCISYSGRCLMSNYMTGRDSNLGDCSQPCRWNYRVLEEKQRPGEYFPIEETENGTTIMSSKDLRLVRYLPEILETGVVGLKIEGRNKSEYYLATTAHAYREALDLTNKAQYTEKDKKRLESELEKLNYRGYTTGFIFGDAKSGETYEGRAPIRKWDYVGAIISQQSTIDNPPVIPAHAGISGETRSLNRSGMTTKNGLTHEIIVKNKITKGDKVEILIPEGVFQDKIVAIFDEKSNELAEVNPGKTDQKAAIKLQKGYPVNSFIRKQLR